MNNLLTVIIPVLHEEKNIGRLLDQLSKQVKVQSEILIIYDIQNDPTISAVNKYFKNHKNLSIRLIKNSVGEKRGAMYAIKTGFENAKGDSILVLMADLSDDLSIVDKMYEEIKNGSDIVCGSRYMKGGKKIGGPFIKTLLSKFAGISLHLFGMPTNDSTNAFKMYRKSVLEKIKIESTGGFEYSLEIITKAFQLGYKIIEIPSTWKDRDAEKSKFKLRKWLPNYIKLYLRALEVCVSKFTIPENLYYVFLLVLSLIFQFSAIGSQIRTKIPISSTLDFSWTSDFVERFLHGFIAGKDFIFTYGPLYQLIYSLPALIFKLPSYLSVAYMPLVTTVVLFIILIMITRLICEEKIKRIFLFSFLLFIVGLAAYPSSDIIKILLPIAFALIWTKYLLKVNLLRSIITITTLPTIFGAFSYDLFIYCFTIAFILSFVKMIVNKIDITKIVIPLILIFLYQLIFSIILSGGLNYTYYSFQTSKDFVETLTTKWTPGNTIPLVIFPITLIFFTIHLIINKSNYNRENLKYIFVLILVSFIEFQTAFVRSDSGHILRALYPSIITCFVIIYFIGKNNFRLLLLGILIFVFIPYKPNLSLSIADIKFAINAIKIRPSFLDVYKIDTRYSLNNKDIKNITGFISKNKNIVFVFPYDSYLLNIANTTYNSFPLLYYQYSYETEIDGIKIMQNNPPTYIILGIDGKSVIDLDQTPNLTRNPNLFKWLLANYSPYVVKDNFMILELNDKLKSMSNSKICSLFGLRIKSQGKLYNLLDSLTQLVKKDIFYLSYNENVIRLPKLQIEKEYLIFSGHKNSSEMNSLFKQRVDFSSGYIKDTSHDNIFVVKYSFFDMKKNTINLSGQDTEVICYN
jgi:dolichol-phosphate mannosyltransferase